jgi:hypothetical protein
MGLYQLQAVRQSLKLLQALTSQVTLVTPDRDSQVVVVEPAVVLRERLQALPVRVLVVVAVVGLHIFHLLPTFKVMVVRVVLLETVIAVSSTAGEPEIQVV